MYQTKKLIRLRASEGYFHLNTETDELKYYVENDLQGNIKPAKLKEKSFNNPWISQHLYVVSEEWINDGDWCLEVNITNKPLQIFQAQEFDIIDQRHLDSKFLKIIATTDQTKNIPLISHDFIELYCKKKEINEVKVEYELDWYINGLYTSPNGYILKKDENNCIITKVEGDKYSKQEVMQMLYDCSGFLAHKADVILNGNDLDEWIKQNL